MIIQWGRKGLVAGALAVSFITPVAAPVTTTINEANIRPSHKLEVRHITPVAVVPTNTLKRVQIRPDARLEFRHITPSADIPTPEVKNGVYRGKPVRDRILKDDEELLEIITMLASFDELI